MNNNYVFQPYQQGSNLTNTFNPYLISDNNISAPQYSVLSFRPIIVNIPQYQLVPTNTIYSIKTNNNQNLQKANIEQNNIQKKNNIKKTIPVTNINVKKDQDKKKQKKRLVNSQLYEPYQVRNVQNIPLDIENQTFSNYQINTRLPQKKENNTNIFSQSSFHFYPKKYNQFNEVIDFNYQENNNNKNDQINYEYDVNLDNININNQQLDKYEEINIVEQQNQQKKNSTQNDEYEYFFPKNETTNYSNNEIRESKYYEQKKSKDFNIINGEIISNNNSREYYRLTKGNLVKSYAYYEEQNVGSRFYMEDKGKSIENFNGDPNKLLFCLYDGHGGAEVSQFLQDNFSIYLKKMLSINDHFVLFPKLFQLLDEKIKELDVPYAGSTCSVVYIQKQQNKKKLYCANVGDTKCVIVNRKGTIQLSYDDLVTDEKENKRIKDNGGFIYKERIGGSLMLSRTLGDWNLKEYGAISVPHVIKYKLDDDDLFLVMASDGVWDMIKDSELEKFYQMSANSLDFCKNIIVESLERGSRDNMSCFCIDFK
jgi:serine/threonine protein phosphatase PrpC